MPKAARVGDSFSTGHLCTAVSTIASGTPKCIIGGSNAARVGDISVSHTYKVGTNCVPHVVPILSGSSKCIIDGAPAARIGDSIDSGSIISGASNCIIG